MKKFSFKLVWAALKDSFKGFSDDKVTKLSASLAYYTVFSLAPLMIVLIFIAGAILGREAVEGSVYEQLNSFIGHDAAAQIQEIIKNASLSDKSGFAMVIGIAALLVGATTVFAELQDSINGIWGLKARPKKGGIMKLLQTRLLSFGIIGSLGFLLLVSLAATAIVEGIGNRLKAYFPDITVVVFYIVNLVLTLGVVTTLFAVIFKVLPDAKMKWKDVWPGAIATSLLFLLGKFAISLYISKSEIGTSYGTAGSFVILLLWVYYSAIILYFGAEFTKSYAMEKGARIQPNEYTEWIDQPVIAGASSEKPAPGNRKPDPGRAPGRRSPEPAFASQSRRGLQHHNKKEKESGGMGTMLLGLALYLFKPDRSKK